MPYTKKSKVGRPHIRPPKRRELPQLHPLQLFRVGRLAEIFDVDPSTIFRWRKEGVLPPFREVGGVRGLTGEQITEVYNKTDEAAS